MDITILAIDLGKYKSVDCVLDPRTGEFRFTTFDTTRAELQKRIAREKPAVVVIEACLLAGWVHDLCGELGVRCLVANTASEAWKFKNLKRKTDRDDALRLAQLYVLDQLPTVTLPTTTVRQWRSLMTCRQTWVGRRVAVQNRIRALFVAQGLPAPRGAKAWSTTGLAGIATQAKPLAECGPDELWRGVLDLSLTEYRQVCELVAQAEAQLDALGKQNADVILLQTTPGLGPRTAEVVRPISTTRLDSKPPSKCRPTAAWCHASISRARWIDAGGSPSAARRCCGSCSWNAPGACSVTTAGRAAFTCG